MYATKRPSVILHCQPPKNIQSGIISYGNPVNRTIKSGPYRKGGSIHTYMPQLLKAHPAAATTAITTAITAVLKAARKHGETLAQTKADTSAAHVEAV